ncbi:hypothetical protein HPB51_019616 [Rhipicephalus microplus]|uniref:Tick transposon n=1 Tax=Rhipicephalus microplus TaxID=6941 RepID=A0A9J6DIC2_RHIMP|nr:hypothetical protein HPB51_019616 [Rhipicephalus microplus]
MSPNLRLLLLEQVFFVCGSLQAGAYSACVAVPAADTTVIDHEHIVDATLERRHPGTRIERFFAGPLKLDPLPAAFSGHGSTAKAMSPNLRLLLLEQVSFYSEYCYKTDNRFVVVLPCPSVLFSGFSSLCLLLSDDVELNPGPDVKVLLKELSEGQKSIKADLSALRERMTKMEDAIQKIKDQGKKIGQLTKTVTNLNVTLSRQEERLISLKDRSRRNNLLVFRVEEGEAETTEDLEQAVLQDIFVRRLGVELKTVERIHRIGRKGGRSPRPVIIKLYDFREKLTVCKNCKKAKRQQYISWGRLLQGNPSQA